MISSVASAAASEGADHWVLGPGTPSAWSAWTDAFVQRLRELGWIEGRTVAIEYRWAEGGQAKLGKHGGKRVPGQQGVNNTLKRGTGNVAYTLARLEACGRTDLVRAVLDREISAYAVSVMMGWAKRRKTVCAEGDHNKSRRLAFDIRALIG